MESTKERIRLEEPGQRGHKSPKEIQENVDSFKETECKPLNVVSFELKHGLHEKYIVECHKYDKKKINNFIQNAIAEAQANILQFEGGRIKHFLDQWKQITTEKEILKIVNGIGV